MPITVQTTDGRTVQFPDGTSREQMEAALRQLPPVDAAQSQEPQPRTMSQREADTMRFNPRASERITIGRVMPKTREEFRQGTLDTAEALPVVGGAVGAYLGSGALSIPGAALGGAGGEAARQLIRRGLGESSPETPLEAAKDIGLSGAREGAVTALGMGVTRGVTATGRAVSNQAKPLVRSAVKPIVSQLKSQAGASRTGVSGQANRVADIILRRRIRTPEQAQAAVASSEQRLQGVLGALPADATVDTATRVPRYLGRLERSAGQQIMPRHDVGAVREAAGEVMKGPLAEDVTRTVMRPSPSGLVDDAGRPAMVPVDETTRAMRTNVHPSEALELARGSGRWGNKKAWGELKGAEQEASKTAERGVRDAIKASVPEAEPILREQGEALQILPVLDRMALREGNRDAISLPAYVMAAGGGSVPSMLTRAGIANWLRNNQLTLGLGAQSAGPAIQGAAAESGTMTTGMLRAAILAKLLGGDE